MSDAHDAFDGPSDSAPLAPELAALIERIETDALLWETHAPAHDGRLAAYARELAGEATRSAGGVVLLERPILDGERPGGIRSAAPRQPWAGRVLAYVSALVVVALIAGSLTLFRHPFITVPTSTPAATATATAAPMATRTVTPRPTSIVAPVAVFPVARAMVDTSPVSWVNDHCDATMPFTLMATFWLASGAPGGSITYRWSRSDGYVGPEQSVSYQTGELAVTDPAYGTWDVPAAEADGTDKWAEVEVLSPNAMVSPHAVIQATCQFTVESATASYVSGGDGKNPPGYDCTAGGDQTFTFAGTIAVSPAPGSHTLQYHWQRSDGSFTQVYTVTLAPGAASAAVQQDSVVIHQTDTNSGQPRTDEVIVDSAPGTPVYAAQFSKFCPPYT